jgi:hypothetical protein
MLNRYLVEKECHSGLRLITFYEPLIYKNTKPCSATSSVNQSSWRKYVTGYTRTVYFNLICSCVTSPETLAGRDFSNQMVLTSKPKIYGRELTPILSLTHKIGQWSLLETMSLHDLDPVDNYIRSSNKVYCCWLNQNLIHDEIKSRLNSGNALYSSLQKRVFSSAV